MRVAKTIELDEHTERELRVLAKRRTLEARLQQRALLVLLAAEGRQNKDIAVEAGLDRCQVAMWRQRFLAGGIDALRKDAPRSGRPATITAEIESRIVQATLHAKPVNATHWSIRTLAEQLGVGATTVRRVWQNNGLKPHLSRTFKLSRDPRFEDKLLDVVGLYRNPRFVMHFTPTSASWLNMVERHSDALKRAVVERSLEPGASVAAIALEAGVNANLLFNWRRLYLQAEVAAAGATAAPVLLPVTVVAAVDSAAPLMPTPPGALPRVATAGTIEIDIHGARVRLRGAVDEASIRSVLRALASAT